MSTKTTTIISITCDGPRCGAHQPDGAPVHVSFTDDGAREDWTGVPDAFFRFIKVQASPGEEKLVEFCSVKCLKDYLDYEYVWPLSPREKAAKVQSNSRFDQEPVSQADGIADFTPGGGGN